MDRRAFLISTAAVATMPTSLLLEGCSPASISQNIVDWTPVLQSTAATLASTLALLAPEEAVLVNAALIGFDAATNLDVSEAKAYLANPGQSTLQALQTGVITLQQQLNSALLSAAKIVDPKSQQAVTAAINAVATVVNSMFALILQIKGNTIAQAANVKTVRLQQVMPYLDLDQAARIVALHNGSDRWPDDVAIARIEVADGLARIQRAGF